MDLEPMLRPLHASDLPTVESWLRAFVSEHRAWWTEAYGAEPGTPLDDVVAAERDDLLGHAESEDHFVRVRACAAESSEHASPLGIVYARIRQDRYMGLRVGVLGWIYVDPRSRGKGVAGELMDAAEAWFVECGAAGRDVFVTAANERAVGLYRRHGYRVVDHRMLKRGFDRSS